MIRLVFLGRLADVAGGPERSFAADGRTGLARILSGLEPALVAALDDPRIRYARNGELVPREGLELAPGDELAFLPPVSGG